MPLTGITPEVDAVAQTCQQVDQIYDEMLANIARSCGMAIEAVKHNQRHTAQEFWTRLGTSGGAVLVKLRTFIELVAANKPELLTPEIAAAGTGVTVHQDGTVTVNA